MRYFVTVEGRTLEVEVEAEGVRVDGTPVEADLVEVPRTDRKNLLLDGASHSFVARPEGKEGWMLHFRGFQTRSEIVDERTRTIREMTGAAAGPTGPAPILAPMPGLVVSVDVEVGDEVREGQGVVIVEAMKMENELEAPADGRVTEVHVAPGEAVDKGQVLVEFEEIGEAE